MLTSDGTLYVGGQVGWDENEVFQTHDFTGQMEQVLKNIRAIVEAAGGSVTDIVRLTWYLTDKDEYLSHQKEIGAAYRRILGRHFPAMAVVIVADLIEQDALLEIEATAKII
ncbi:MAG: RidA family protein [Rhodobacteraceae bacterium]|nr:RidA family protein [Paracoccaceae bacterium]